MKKKYIDKEKTILKVESGKPGPTLAIFACIHGNEPVGKRIFDYTLPKFSIKYGTVYFIIGNPRACKKNKRYIESDLNRSFRKDIPAKTYEQKRARKLMKILNTCEASLDLHSTSPTPFIICEKNTFDAARYFPIQHVSRNWDSIHPGATEGYMWHCGKPALCIEFSSTRQTQLGMKCIQIFLTYFGCTSGKEKLKVYSQTHSSITQELRTQSNSFKFVKKIKTLSRVPNNTPIAYDGALKYVTDRNTVIFFPSQPKKKGDYACIIGEIIKK